MIKKRTRNTEMKAGKKLKEMPREKNLLNVWRRIKVRESSGRSKKLEDDQLNETREMLLFA
jgi:hypothetical protein